MMSETWTEWYAWYPVKTEDHGWVWLYKVWRAHSDGLMCGQGMYLYRLNPIR